MNPSIESFPLFQAFLICLLSTLGVVIPALKGFRAGIGWVITSTLSMACAAPSWILLLMILVARAPLAKP